MNQNETPEEKINQKDTKNRFSMGLSEFMNQKESSDKNRLTLGLSEFLKGSSDKKQIDIPKKQ